MDQTGSQRYVQQKENHNKVTYLTTYEQFLYNQLPKYVHNQNSSEANIEETNEDDVIIENNAKRKRSPERISPDIVSSESNISDDCTLSENNASENLPMIFFVEDVHFEQTLTENSVDENTSIKSPTSIEILTHNDVNQSPPLLASLETVTYQTDIEEPMIALDETPTTAYECTICSFETIYEDIFNEHALTHMKPIRKKTRKETFHKCPRCSFKVMCKSKVKKHMVIYEDGETKWRRSGKLVYCGLYSYSRECEVDLDPHLRMHDREEQLAFEHSYTLQ